VRNKVDGGAIPRGLPGATTADRGGPASLAWPLAGVAAFAILTAVGARLVVFREPVPVTLQVYFVLAAGMVLGSRMGALSQLAYLGLGLSGVPVFAAPPHAGVGCFLGPTGGYLVGFVAAAYVAGFCVERWGSPREGLPRVIPLTVAGLAGLAALYVPGLAWLTAWMALRGGGFSASLACAWASGVAPFLALDSLKAAAASLSVVLCNRRLCDKTQDGDRHQTQHSCKR